MKRLAALILVFSAFFLSFKVKADYISAKAAILISYDTGEVLYSLNPDIRLPMASTTKIMTALVVLENGELDKPVTVTKEMIAVEGTSMGLSCGDTLKVKDLLCGMMIVSGNDAANALAVAVGGSYDRFVAMMNKKAAELGLENTHFETPSGLDGDSHYTSAYDLARITREALSYDEFAGIVALESVALTYGDPPCKRYLSNHNKLIKMYSDVKGVKTGFTKKSGRCLVSAAEKDQKKIIAVTLNDPNDWDDHRKLLDLGFSTLKMQSISGSTVSLPVVGSNIRISAGLPGREIGVSKDKNIGERIIAPAFLYSPVKKGEIIGYAEYYIGDDVILKENLVSDTEIKADENKLIEYRLIFLKIIRCINEG